MKKSQKNNKIKTREIVGMIFLAIIFFGLMYLSTSQTNLDLEYNYLDEVEIKNYNQLQLAEVNVNNPGFLATRVFLKSFVLCDEKATDPYLMQLTVSYATRDVTSQGQSIFEDYYRESIELESNENRTLGLITYVPYTKAGNQSVTKELKLYEVSGDEKFSYCLNPDEKDFVKSYDVEVTMQLS